MNTKLASEYSLETVQEKKLTGTPPTLVERSVKLYSPRKVLVAALLGGIAGGCILHWLNFKALNQEQKANQTLVWCVPLLIVLPIFFLLTNITLNGSGAGIAAGFMMDAKKAYGALYTQHSRNSGNLGGWWATIGIGIVGFLLSLCISVPVCLLTTFVLHLR